MSVIEELWVPPFAPFTIISSSPSAPSRLTLHSELHAYRHSSAGTGFGCLLLVVYLLTIKTGFAFPAGRFRLSPPPGLFNLGCVNLDIGTRTGCFPPEINLSGFLARVGINVDLIM